jgi:NADPH:quinone reductase-like Zn-dependent oxidoreductase
MASVKQNLPTTQSALRWVKENDTDPFQWSTSAPVINPSQLGDNQVLIQNHAVSLNPIDYKITSRNFTQTILPAVTGYDVSGQIVAVGKDVKDFKVGDQVFGVLNINSSNGGGALQQYSVGETETLIKKPANISHADAATLGIAFLSALVCIFLLLEKVIFSDSVGRSSSSEHRFINFGVYSWWFRWCWSFCCANCSDSRC